MGSVLSRLEPPRARFPPAPRLPFLHQHPPPLTPHRHPLHLLSQRLRARARHVVYLQEAPRVLDGHADDAAAASGREPNEVDEGQERVGEPVFLGGHLHRPEFLV